MFNNDTNTIVYSKLFFVIKYICNKNNFLGAILDFDGGKHPFTAGEFNKLSKYTEEEWDQIAKLIRTKAKSS